MRVGVSGADEMPSVCIVMPAFNEQESIRRVLRDIRRTVGQFSHELVVVNDGSRDRTSDIAMSEGALVIDLPLNLGIGGAVQTGMKYAQRRGFDLMIEIDADGQHDPSFLSDLLRSQQRTGADMVIGSRFLPDTAHPWPWLRLAGIRTFSGLIQMVTGRKIYDSTSGYRCYSKGALAFLSERYPADFPEPESIVMLLNAGFRVVEVPTQMGNRSGGQSVIGKRDLSFKAAYFVLSNAIAILISGLKVKRIDAD